MQTEIKFIEIPDAIALEYYDTEKGWVKVKTSLIQRVVEWFKLKLKKV